MDFARDRSLMRNEPLRLAFLGLSTSELDLFTHARRAPGVSLVLVVDPGPLGTARRLGEIAGAKVAATPEDLPKFAPDWIVTGKLARGPSAALNRCVDEGAVVLDAAEAAERLKRLCEPEQLRSVEAAGVEAGCGAGDYGDSGVGEEASKGAESAAEAAALVAARTGAGERKKTPGEGGEVRSPAPPVLSPDEGADPEQVVRWALEGLMSSVRGSWGALVAKASGGRLMAQRGVELENVRPDLLEWLEGSLAGNGGEGGAASAPSDSGRLVCVLLKSDSEVVGRVLLGRDEGSDPFSQADLRWLEKVSERIASILSGSRRYSLGDDQAERPPAPASLWAAPLVERVEWARGWMQRRFHAVGCWLFTTPEGSAEPVLVDEDFGSVSPRFLAETVGSAMESADASVFVDEEDGRALVFQPLAPWGSRWVVVLEGVPWRGEGRAIRARIKRAAATLAKLMRSP